MKKLGKLELVILNLKIKLGELESAKHDWSNSNFES